MRFRSHSGGTSPRMIRRYINVPPPIFFLPFRSTSPLAMLHSAFFPQTPRTPYNAKRKHSPRAAVGPCTDVAKRYTPPFRVIIISSKRGAEKKIRGPRQSPRTRKISTGEVNGTQFRIFWATGSDIWRNGTVSKKWFFGEKNVQLFEKSFSSGRSREWKGVRGFQCQTAPYAGLEKKQTHAGFWESHICEIHEKSFRLQGFNSALSIEIDSFSFISECFRSGFKVFSWCFPIVVRVFSICFQSVFGVFSKCFHGLFGLVS